MKCISILAGVCVGPGLLLAASSPSALLLLAAFCFASSFYFVLPGPRRMNETKNVLSPFYRIFGIRPDPHSRRTITIVAPFLSFRRQIAQQQSKQRPN